MEKKDFVRTIQANRGIIRSLCKVYYYRNEDQKDAFQDIVLQLWKSYESFRGDSEIHTWIYRVSLNTILTSVRKNKKSVSTEPLDSAHHFVSNSNADDNTELLHIVIQSLNATDKAIVILYLEGYGNKEIAKMLELSSTNISTRLNRIKSVLKKKFNKKPHETKQT